jgi:hypothetical protein
VIQYDTSLVQVKLTQVLTAFLTYGWRLENPGNRIVVYAPENPGTAPQIWPAAEKAAAMRYIDQQAEKQHRFMLTLTWPAPETSASLIFEPNIISVGIDEHGRQKLEGTDGITDHSWYVLRIVQPLESLGLGIATIKWIDIT